MKRCSRRILISAFCLVLILSDLPAGRGESIVPGGQIPSSLFSYDGEYRGPLTPVTVTEGAIDQFLSDSLDDRSLQILLGGGMIPKDDEISNALSYINKGTSALDVAVGAKISSIQLEKIFSRESLEKINPVLSTIGAASVMGRIAYQLNKGVALTTVASDNAIDVVESALSIAALYTGSASLAFAATAVFAAGLAYDAVYSGDPSGWEEYIYHYFNERFVLFNTETLRCEVSLGLADSPEHLDLKGNGMSAAFEAIYTQFKQDPKKLQEALNTFISSYVDTFWVIDGFYRTSAMKHFLIHSYNPLNPLSYPGEYPKQDPGTIEKYKTNFRGRLIWALKPVMQEYYDRCYQDLKQALLDDIRFKYLPSLNQVITFEIIDPMLNGKTFDNSPYVQAGYQITFGDPVLEAITSGDFILPRSEDYLFRAKAGSNEVYRCTLFAYLARGCPNTVMFYKDEYDWGTEAAEIRLDLPLTTITLARRDPSWNSLTFESADLSDNAYIEAILSIALRDKGTIRRTAEDNRFAITAAASAEEERPRSDPVYYQESRIEVRIIDLVIDGLVFDGGPCTLSATVEQTAFSEDGSAVIQDGVRMPERLRTDVRETYVLQGNGTVTLIRNMATSQGKKNLMALVFEALSVNGSLHRKEVYELGSETETREDVTIPVSETYALTLRFYFE